MVGLICTMFMGSLQEVKEVPFRIGDDAIIVDVSVNGRSASLMYDTGFSGAVVIGDSLDIGKPTAR